MHSVPLPQGNLSPTVVALVAHLADHQSASPTANPPVLLPERNAEQDPDNEPPPSGGGGAALTPEQRAANQRLVADNLVRYQKELRDLAAREARRWGCLDPDDVADTATANMLRYGSMFDAQRPFLAWAATVTYHAALEELRKQKRLPNAASAQELEAVVDRAAGPVWVAGTNDLLARVAAWAESHLDAKHYVSWRLWRDGYSDDDASAWLGIPRGTHSLRVWRSNWRIANELGHLVDFGIPKPPAKPHKKAPRSAA